uniref:Uncharacterized protein n=1 Tax=Salvator merianae TaxID=96440 RepID=A0A8D0BC29_SALMN
MEASMVHWAIVLLSLTVPVTSELQYLVAFPAVIYHTSTERFCTFLRSIPETVHLTVTLEMKIQNHILLEKDIKAPGIYECISFKVPAFTPRKERGRRKYQDEVASVYVLIQEGGKVRFEGRKKVQVQSAFVRNIVETDKPFYKPGERAKFRIVRLDDELKAIDEPVSITFL